MYKLENRIDQIELRLYALVQDGVTCSQVIDALRDAPDTTPIVLRINSDGGSAWEAIALYNVLKPRDVTVYVDGVCASAASVIAMAGKHIVMMPGSMMMIHSVMTQDFSGTSEELRLEADVVDKINGEVAKIYAERTGNDINTILDMMSHVVWMNAEEAVEHGFADEAMSTPSQPEQEQEQEQEASTLQEAYERGVTDERERIRGIDELYTPSRWKLLVQAKYEEPMTAKDIALRLLKAPSEQPDRTDRLTSFTLPHRDKVADEVESIAQLINQQRGAYR